MKVHFFILWWLCVCIFCAVVLFFIQIQVGWFQSIIGLNLTSIFLNNLQPGVKTDKTWGR